VALPQETCNIVGFSWSIGYLPINDALLLEVLFFLVWSGIVSSSYKNYSLSELLLSSVESSLNNSSLGLRFFQRSVVVR
jgi:hypothetical protein